jgi:hypothetical protein
MSLCRTVVPAETPEVWHSLRGLLDRYEQNRELWTARELAHRRCVRWLVQGGLRSG